MREFTLDALRAEIGSISDHSTSIRTNEKTGLLTGLFTILNAVVYRKRRLQLIYFERSLNLIKAAPHTFEGSFPSHCAPACTSFIFHFGGHIYRWI